MTAILDRLDVALEKVRARQMEVRAIYLDEEDRELFDAVNTAAWREHLGSEATFYATKYRGHDIRSGERSAIYSTHGVAVGIRKRLSRRVRHA